MPFWGILSSPKQRMEDVIMATITKDTIVGDILDIAPETATARSLTEKKVE